MALGKAFIEVHADTKPFARELGRELNKILAAAEKDVKASSRKIGQTISTEVGKGVERNQKKVTSGVDKVLTGTLGSGAFSKFAKGIVDTIDDGLSGLPAELKVALGAAVAVAAPFAFALGAQIAGALTAGLLTFGGVGFAALIGAQFENVRDRAVTVAGEIRDSFLNSVRLFTGPLLAAIQDVRDGFNRMREDLVVIFANSVLAVRGVTDALLGLAEEALPGITAAFGEIDSFIMPMRVGFRLIGESVGNFFATIAKNKATPEVLYDILITVSNLIDVFTSVVDAGLDLFHILSAISSVVTFGAIGSADYGEEINRMAKEFKLAEINGGGFADAVEGGIIPLERQSEEIEDYNRLIKELVAVTTAAVTNEISFQQGIDDLTESLKKNGDTLNLHKQAGRDNAQVLLQLADTIRRTRDDTISLTGNVAEAEAKFASQRAEVYRVAKQMGLSRTEVDKLIKSILEIPPPKPAGVTGGSLTRLEAFNQALQDTIYLQGLIDPTYNPRGPGGQQRYADGGIVTGPTSALIGEAGAEVVIPLTKPARAAELVAQSGLGQMMGTNVNVYIGNQQIDAYIATQTNRQLAMSARAMNYGTRGI